MNEPANFYPRSPTSNQPNAGLLLVGGIVGAVTGLMFLPMLALFVTLALIVVGGRKLWRWTTRADARGPTLETDSLTRELSTASKK